MTTKTNPTRHIQVTFSEAQVLLGALEGMRDELAARIAKLRSSLAKPAPKSAQPVRRKLSKEARAKISAAQKKRWAKSRKASKPPKPPKLAKVVPGQVLDAVEV